MGGVAVGGFGWCVDVEYLAGFESLGASDGYADGEGCAIHWESEGGNSWLNVPPSGQDYKVYCSLRDEENAVFVQ